MRTEFEWMGTLIAKHGPKMIDLEDIRAIQADVLRHAAEKSHWAWKNAKTSEARGIGYNIFTTLTDQASVLEREQK